MSRGSEIASKGARQYVSGLFLGRLLPRDYLQQLCGLEGQIMGTAALQGTRKSNLTQIHLGVNMLLVPVSVTAP